MQKILTILCVILLPIAGSGQSNSVNSNWKLNTHIGNNTSVGGCPTFTPGSIPEWDITHGTPAIIQCSDFECMRIRLDPTGPAIPVTSHTSDGVLIYYDFKQGEEYIVKTKICNYDIVYNTCTPFINVNTFWGGSVNYTLTENYPLNRSMTACHDLIPSTGIGAQQSIGQVFDTDPLYNEFHFTANHDFHHLWIFLTMPFQENDLSMNINLQFAMIQKKCRDVICVFGNPITPDNYAARQVHTGTSTPCNKPNSVAITDPQSITTFTASEYVLLTKNFTASAQSGGYFEATVNPYICSEVNTGYEEGVGEKFSSNANRTSTANNENKMDKYFHSKPSLQSYAIHPNPTTGQLTITMPAQGDYDVKITNMLGVVVYQGKLKDEQQKQIELESSLPSGNYTVQITGKEVNHIEKIILTR